MERNVYALLTDTLNKASNDLSKAVHSEGCDGLHAVVAIPNSCVASRAPCEL